MTVKSKVCHPVPIAFMFVAIGMSKGPQHKTWGSSSRRERSSAVANDTLVEILS